LTFSEHLACAHCGLSFEELAPRNFSFNSPYGACPQCDGLGTYLQVDPELVVPDQDLSMEEGAVAPWGGVRDSYWYRLLEAVADAHGFSMKTPWRKLSKSARDVVLYGSQEQVHVRYRNRWGRVRSYWSTFEGSVRSPWPSWWED
jgi:excinuclease ABC subunit A